MLMLEALGIPTTYSPEKVSTTVGQQLLAFSDDEIRKLLSHGHGLLLDAVAARVIFERGFGELIGLEAIGESRNIDTQPNGPYSAEEFFNPDFGGAARRYLTATIPDLGSRPSISLMTPAARATIVSQFVDPDARRSSIASYAFENASGGRAFVIAYDLATAFGGSFNHPFRADLMRGAINWLAHDQPAVHVQGDGVYPLAFRKDLADESIVGMFNLTLDEWPGATFTLGDNRTVAGVKVLEKDGQWHSNRQISVSTAGDGRITIRCDKPIPYLHPLILRVGWK
jgi:hypothetical protein